MKQVNDDFDFNPEDFGDLELDLELEFETRYMKPPKTKDIPESNLKYSDAVKLAKEIEITKGSRYFVVLNGSFYFGDFIEALIVEKNWHVKKLTISTLSMNENNVDSLANICNGGYIQKLDLIVSDFFYAHERNNLIRYAYQELDKAGRFQLAVAGTHCKVCLIETVNGGKVVIHGSANLRTSGNIEQIVIEENASLYDFNDEYQQAIIEKYKTINKSVRNKTLWQVVQTKAEAAKVAGPDQAKVRQRKTDPSRYE